ncbi:unnamed protein product, partial [Ectocarpus fasciculatus]
VSASFRVCQFWCAKDFTCKRTIRSTFEVKILVVSARGSFVFVAGEKEGSGGRGRTKQRAVVAVWDGRKRGKIYPGFGGERDPTRLLTGHGRPIRSLYTPHNPDVLVTTALDATVKVWDVPTGTCTKTIWSKGGLQSPLSYAGLVNRGAWLLTSYEDGSLQVWGIHTGKCLLTLVSAAAAAAADGAVVLPRHGAARLAVSRCGRFVAFAIGARIKVIDFDILADRSAAGGRSGHLAAAYLRKALQFVASPTA